MDVHLNPEIERIVIGKLQSGHYRSVNEVIDEAVRLLEQRDEIRSKIDHGLESLKEGRGIAEEDAFKELRSRHERYKHKK